jgi:hypothetical protein
VAEQVFPGAPGIHAVIEVETADVTTAARRGWSWFVAGGITLASSQWTRKPVSWEASSKKNAPAT